jgi:thioesterase domain-containing protein
VFFKPFYNIILLLKEPVPTKARYIRKKIKNLRLTYLYILSKSGLVKTGLLHRDVEQSSFLTDHVMILMNDALKKYKIKKSGIHIDLFKAGKPSFYIFEPEDYGWKKFALKGVTKHTIPAEHSLLFTPPNDKLFAEIIDERLNEIESKK